MSKYREFGGFCQQEILEANARLLAKRAARAAMKAAVNIPIKTAGELVEELKPLIPIVFVKTPAGYMPLADIVDIVDIISVTGGPGRRRIKLKIRANEAGRAWAGML